MIVIKPATLVEEFDHVYTEDSAVDNKAEGFEDLYREFCLSGDIEKLPMVNGAKPTIWRLAHIRGLTKRRLQDYIRETSGGKGTISPSAAYRACQIALVSATGLKDESNRDIKIDREFDSEIGQKIVTEKCMQMLDGIDDGGLVNELGIRAIIATVLPGES